MVRIGTRRSVLAMWQAELVQSWLEQASPGSACELVPVVTRGDRIQDRPLAAIGGKALFVKEIEDKLLRGEIDLAVHSMKDVPAVLPDGLGIVAVMQRDDPTDAFVARDPDATPSFEGLPAGARIGTGSVRRACQLLSSRPDLHIEPMRGNVDTRLRKLDSGDLHGLVLATAALRRLGHRERITQRLDPGICLPAVGQGAIAVEGRLDDDDTLALARSLNHAETSYRVEAERGLLYRLEGGCRVPIAAYAELDSGDLRLRALVGSPDGRRIISSERTMDRSRARELGVRVAEDILARGGAEVLEALDSEER